MLAVLLAAALEFTARDAVFSLSEAQRLVERHTPRDAGTTNALSAARFICEEAKSCGLVARQDVFRAMTPHGERTFSNVYAEIGGRDGRAGWVVFMSHFDTKHGCPGANDGASTSGLLLGLGRAFVRASLPRLNVMLVWTDGEECMVSYGAADGFWGSKRAAEVVAARGIGVRAVVCLDMLGDRELAVSIPANGTASLRRLALQAAERAGCGEIVSPVGYFVKDDHVAFLDRGFPAIDLIDFDYGPHNAHWHTPADTLDKISEGSLLKSGRLVCEIANLLL